MYLTVYVLGFKLPIASFATPLLSVVTDVVFPFNVNLIVLFSKAFPAELVAVTVNEDPSLYCIFKVLAFNVVVESLTYNFLEPEAALYLLFPLYL